MLLMEHLSYKVIYYVPEMLYIYIYVWGEKEKEYGIGANLTEVRTVFTDGS